MFSKRKITATLLSLLLVAATLWLQGSDNNLIREIRDRIEYIAYDIRLNLTLPENYKDDRIAIVDIDEKSLQSVGHWPWPRNIIAKLTDNLFELGAIVVAFDMVFAEADPNNAKIILDKITSNPNEDAKVISRLQELVPEFNHDQTLAKSLKDRDAILGFVFHERESSPVGRLPTPLKIENLNAIDINSIRQSTNFTANLDILQGASGFGGFISTAPDADGSIRRSPIIFRHENNIYTSLGFEAARLFLLIDSISITTEEINNQERMEYVNLGKYNIPTDSDGNVLIPYRGRHGTFQYISAGDILNKKINQKDIENKIILIGTSAEGLYDLRPTPVGGAFAGVEIHANIISGILNNKFPVEPPWADGANFTFIVFLGLLLTFILPQLNAIWMFLTSVIIGFSVVALNLWLWSQYGLVLALATPMVLILIMSIMNLAYGFFVETTIRHQLKNRFGQYVPPQLVEEMNRNPEKYSADGVSKEMSVLFADIRNFTSISESLTATELKDMLNRFFTPMTRVIFNQRGTIDKYVGDMIMAFWGAPVADPKHSINAIEAALEMLEEVERLKPEFKKLALPEVNIGIGINTGIMNVGDMGSDYRRAYTVLGDSVNLASRLEGLTKFYGVGLVVSEYTKDQAESIIYRMLDLVRVKGKKQAVRVYEPICKKEDVNPDLINELEQHDKAFTFYLKQDWNKATQLFEQLKCNHPDKHVYQLFLDRIKDLRLSDLGSDWDGVFDRQTK